MDKLTTCSCIGGRFPLLFQSSPSSSTKNRSFPYRRSSFFPVLASQDGPPELDRWDQMELKFGRLLGEDPKLTLAKVIGRKSNPDVSYLDIEKSFFRKKKGKPDDNDDMVGVPLDANVEEHQPSTTSPDSFQVSTQTKSTFRDNKLNLLRPAMNKGIRAARPTAPVVEQPSQLPGKTKSESSPSFTLRKPNPLQEDHIEMEKLSRLKIKPNLFLKMRKGPSESPSDVTLLKKPEVMKISLNTSDRENASSSESVGSRSGETGIESFDGRLLDSSAMPSSKKDVEALDDLQHNSFGGSATEVTMDLAINDISNDVVSLASESSESEEGLKIGLQPPEQSGVGTHEKEANMSHPVDLNSVQYHGNISLQTSLQGKPMRLDSLSTEMSHPIEAERIRLGDEGHKEAVDVGHSLSSEQKECEDNDWKRAEDLLRTGDRVEVELISCSSRGFVVQFGLLIGFLPYRNLGTKWKFLAFESWLRKKGLDPSLYRQNLSIVGNYEVQNKNLMLESNENLEMDEKDEEKLSPDMKFEDLLQTYDQEKTKFLSSFVGQRIKVTVVLIDRKSRRLIFSGRPKEKEELVERKRSLMAKLSIGDVVKCCIKKITYFGIFVEVEGVPALIHQSEVSWDATLDPSSFFKIGQIVDAKVHQLDYALERITLSLKDITPDPLNEALESVVGENGNLEAAQGDFEWADVESLIKELQEIDGVIGVSKGRFFLSPGLAPTFQVYMASMYGNQYKLLARYENMVQEVIVQASLDKEQMKAAILTCTNRVV